MLNNFVMLNINFKDFSFLFLSILNADVVKSLTMIAALKLKYYYRVSSTTNWRVQ